MAKQRGIHQIKGKINNLCYYEQKYVRGGLIRRINEAMSERLKTDPVFVNTRRANTIFGGASLCAGAILEFFSSRATYLFKPYRHAILTKFVKKYLSAVVLNNNFPTYLTRTLMYSSFSNIIDNIVKNKLRDYFPSIAYQYNALDLSIEHEIEIPFNELVAFCEKNKCIGIQFSTSPSFYIYESNYGSGTDGYEYPRSNPGGRARTINWLKDSGSTDSISLLASTGDTDDAYTFWIIYATPILRMEGTRPITGKVGASCGVVPFTAS